MTIPRAPWRSLTSVARLASRASDVRRLARAVLEPLRHLGAPLALRAPLNSTDEGVVPCAYAADLVEGRLSELSHVGLGGAVIAGLGDAEPIQIDVARLRTAGPGVPDWARTGLWLPNAGVDAPYRGLVALAPSNEVMTANLAAWLEVAASIVAGHAARIVSKSPATGDASVAEAVHGPPTPDATTSTPRPAEQRLDLSNNGFRALIEHSQSATLLLDAEATILYASPAAERILQVPAALQLGQYGMGLMHPDDLHVVQDRFERAWEEPGSVFEAQGRVCRADGAWRWLDVTGTNLPSEPTVGYRNLVVIEDCRLEHSSGWPGSLVEEFDLEAGKERFDHRIVEGTSDPTDAAQHAALFQVRAERKGRVLRPDRSDRPRWVPARGSPVSTTS